MSSPALDVTRQTPRRSLTSRQAATVQKLTDAAVAEIRATGYDGLTVRNVAKRAGVAPATAYTYFASKEHLLTEAYWRLLEAMPGPKIDLKRPLAPRVAQALAGIAKVADDAPELVAAVTFAMLADDPDVKRLRDRVGAEFHRRLVAALGDDADNAILQTLELALAGALIRAGTGHMSYDEIPKRMGVIATQIVRTP